MYPRTVYRKITSLILFVLVFTLFNLSTRLKYYFQEGPMWLFYRRNDHYKDDFYILDLD